MGPLLWLSTNTSLTVPLSVACQLLTCLRDLGTFLPSHHPSQELKHGHFSPLSSPAEWQRQAAIATSVTWFAVSSVSAHFTHFTGSAVEALQASALSTALDAILAFSIPRAPLARLPWAHLAHVSVVAGAADRPLKNQQVGMSSLVQHKQGTALWWKLHHSFNYVIAIISGNAWKDQMCAGRTEWMP